MNSDPNTTIRPLSQEVFVTLPVEVQHYIQFLEKQLVLLTAQVQGCIAKINELEGRLAKNSSNSNKPPGSDGLKKKSRTSSLRGKSGKKPGGQLGRIGKTLEQVPDPDHIKLYTPESCDHCLENLSGVGSIGVEKRQVFDLPEVDVEVTEHQAEIKICPCCRNKVKGKFPDNVKAPAQYGERTHALAAYFQHQHLIPFERVSQIFEDLYGVSLSPGTCKNMDRRLFKNLEAFELNLKAHLLACKVLCFDETGIRCAKKLNWIHVTASNTATFYGIHRKRGGDALEEFSILPQFTGIAIHDHWHPYFAYNQVKHGLCNVHHLRELKYVYEQEKKEWAQKISTLLLNAKKIADQAREERRREITPEDIKVIENQYVNLMLEIGMGYFESSPPERPLDKSGLNLFKRLLGKMDCVLAFIYDLEISFSNNLAEQDLRMAKVKQKISGCFRTFEGGVISCRIRSYISTSRKQGWRIIDALADAVRGSPRFLPIPT